MCGRFTLAAADHDLDAVFGNYSWPERRLRYNIAPTQQVLILKGNSSEPAWVRWGLVPRWARDTSGAARMINARSETVLEKPAFRDLMSRSRCLVIADGFYEWQLLPDGKKEPLYFQLPGGVPFGFAGLWDTWHDPTGQIVETCTILTRAAPPWLGAIHNRCPVIVDRSAHKRWLDTAQKIDMASADWLEPLTESGLPYARVGFRVNSVANDDSACREVHTKKEPGMVENHSRQGELF